VSLYQLSCGQLPFRADSMTALMYKIANDPHTPLSTIRPDLPQAVERIVDRALAKSPEDRFQTATEMAVALRAAQGALS
jgi:serine/threonine-protein kinase